MRAILLLFMTAPVATGGLGWGAAKAGPIYGLYTAMVYLTALPGGWLADQFIGQRRAVLAGGIVIALGHVSLALHAWFKALLERWGLDPRDSWHWGFGAAAVGMTLGLVQYVLGGRHLGH